MQELLTDFQKQIGYSLDAFQITACECLLQGRSVLVAAPTGSGKTTIAEFATVLARREKDAEIIYTAPIKALSNQKYTDLCTEYGADQVALLTGDVTVNADAPIKVMTTEVLRNIIYADSARLARLEFVVLDEVHFLGDYFRGPVWEEIILHLPAHIRLVCLSATVSNAEELGDWIHAVRGDTEVIISERRPVPLYQHVLTNNALLPLYTKNGFNSQIQRLMPSKRVRVRGRAPRKDSRGHKRISTTDVVQALDETGLTPAIVFIFSRNGCDQAVSRCLFEAVTLTTSAERAKIREVAQQALQDLSAAEQKVLRMRSWLRGLERGFAAHHAGLLPLCKQVVEKLFQMRLLKVVFATETLALGINMPAKAVVIEKLKKFNGIERVSLTSGEYTQLTGRAGRRGIDAEGHAVIVWDDSLDLALLEGLAGARAYPVISRFRPTYNMAVNLLSSRSVSQVRESLERSFAQFQADRAVVEAAAQLRSLQQSLAGYQEAIARTSGTDKLRWQKRAQKLRKLAARTARQIKARTNSIARDFESVCAVLSRLNYIYPLDIEHKTVAKTELEAPLAAIMRPTVWGSGLAKIYGERALLVAECLRRGLWIELNDIEFAALIAGLTYEPRHNDVAAGFRLSEQWQTASTQTLSVWEQIVQLEKSANLESAQMPLFYNAWILHAWASKRPLAEIIESAGINIGDFLRWAKQTADLLGQIVKAIESILDTDAGLCSAGGTEHEQLLVMLELARKARAKIVYGIVENAA